MRRSSLSSADLWLARLWRNESGIASLEFVTVGVALLVPLIYLIVTLAALQSASFAVEGAARQAVRVFVESPNTAEGQAQAVQAARYTVTDYGIAADAATVRVTCLPTPADCFQRLGRVTVTVSTTVTLPLVPPTLALHLPLQIPVEASSTEVVSRFRPSP